MAIVKQEDTFNWEAFEDIAFRVAKTARFSASLLGAFDLEREPETQVEKQRTQRQRKTNVRKQIYLYFLLSNIFFPIPDTRNAT